jgi:hypothetical protein
VLAQPEIYFQAIGPSDLAQEEFVILDRMRKSSYHVVSVEIFSLQLINEEYDIWRLVGLEGCHCLMLTNFVLIPEAKYLEVNYFGGRNCFKNTATLRQAVFDVAELHGCDKVIFKTLLAAQAHRIGADPLVTVYELRRPKELVDGKPERDDGHSEE